MTDLEESYALCHRLARRAASNFSFSFLLLPREKQRAMWALYAYLRYVDDLADDPQFDLQSRKQSLEALRGDLHAAFAHQSSNLILQALTDTAEQYQIPADYLTAVIDGVEMDLDGTSFGTYADLQVYCYRVASVVGLACIHIWGFRGPEAIQPAKDCGQAFQLTNILRNLKEDAQNGRVYLPRDDFGQFAYTVDDLHRGIADQRFRNLIYFEVDRAEQLYRSAAELQFHLDRDGRRAFSAMMVTYRSLLEKIKRDPGCVFRGRVRLGPLQKLRIAANAFFARPMPIEKRRACQTVSS